MKKHLFSLFFMCIALLLASSCQPPETNAEAAAIKPYFDIKGYFTNQIKQLEAQKTSLIKTAFLNDKQETKTLSHLNWQDEFALFINSDINRIAWINSYSTDSCNQITQKHIDYKSLDPDLRTQEIHVWLDIATQQLDSLSVRNKVKNVFYTLDEKLYFSPSKGYIINAIQKARFTPPDTMQITGQFGK